MDPPDAMAKAPQLRQDLVVFWEAFEELSTCRSFIGMTGHPGPIPWTAIEAYAHKHRFSRDFFDDLVAIIRAVDDEFRRLVAEEAKTPNGKPGGLQEEHGGTGG